MMLPTHALAGMAAALPFALAASELGGVSLLAGFLGGLLPDLDLYVGHRKTLHYPVYYPVLAVPALVVVLLAPSPVTVAVAFLLIGAALHSAMDVLGGGLELYPWAATSDRAVYDHFRGRWLAPRRVIPYDGSVEDLALAGLLATALIVVAGTEPVGWLVAAALAVGVVYTAVRRRLPSVAVWLLDRVAGDRLPARVHARLPDRYVFGAERS
jgi:hypothetical protein